MSIVYMGRKERNPNLSGLGRRERNPNLSGSTGYLQGFDDIDWGPIIAGGISELPCLIRGDCDNTPAPRAPVQPAPTERPPVQNPAAGGGEGIPWTTLLLIAGGAFLLFKFAK